MKRLAVSLAVFCCVLTAVAGVFFKGSEVLPSFGSVAGFWLYEEGNAQLLVLGFPGEKPWRVVAVGEGWRLTGTNTDEIVVRSPYSRAPRKGSNPLADEIAGLSVTNLNHYVFVTNGVTNVVNQTLNETVTFNYSPARDVAASVACAGSTADARAGRSASSGTGSAQSQAWR